MKPFFTKLNALLLLSILLASLFAGLGYCQDAEVAKFPNRPISFIVPVPPGGPTDLAIRLITREAEKYLKQPIVIVNKPGAALTIGTAAIAASKPDGYTIGYSGGPPIFLTPLLEKVPYDPLKDFTAIMQCGGFNFGVYVKGDSPFKSFKDLIAFARQNPKKLTYGTVGANSMGNITMEDIAKKEKVEITHIPFKGTPEAQTALLGGHIIAGAGDFNFSLVDSGQIRLLMLLKEEHSAEYPAIPILKDLGYDNPYPMIISVVGPKGIPEGIVKKLEDAFTKAMKEPTFIKGMKDLRLPVAYRNSKELDEYIIRNYHFFTNRFKEKGLIK